MIEIPSNSELVEAEDNRHAKALEVLDEKLRLEMSDLFGIPKDKFFETDKFGHYESPIGVVYESSEYYVRTDDGKFVPFEEKHKIDGCYSKEFKYWHGKMPKKGWGHHKGFSFGFRLLKSPSGLWIPDTHSFSHPPQGGFSGGYHYDKVYISAEEAFAYLIDWAVNKLVGPIEVDPNPREIEVPCPDCVAWAKKHIEVTSHWASNGKTPEMWLPNKEYKQAEYKVLGCELDDEGDPILEECKTCRDNRPDNPWFVTSFSDNKIERDETPEEIAKRLEVESVEREWSAEYQPQAEEFAEQLRGLIKAPSGQLELAL